MFRGSESRTFFLLNTLRTGSGHVALSNVGTHCKKHNWLKEGQDGMVAPPAGCLATERPRRPADENTTRAIKHVYLAPYKNDIAEECRVYLENYRSFQIQIFRTEQYGSDAIR